MSAEPLDQELERFLAPAREREGVPVDLQGRVWARLASVALTPAPPPFRARLAGHPWTLAAASAGVGIAMGVAGTAAVLRRATPPPPPTVDLPARPPPPVPPAPLPAVTPAPAPAQIQRRAAPSAPSGTLAREQPLIDGARSALARGRVDDALAALVKHRALFPDGQLAAEREALEVLARVRSGDARGARAAAASFGRRFPHSLLQPLVDQALAEIGGPR